MSTYFDASVIVALFTNDELTGVAESLLLGLDDTLVVSDFAAAEFASAIARRVRMRVLSPQEARSAFSAFDVWSVQSTMRAHTEAADIATADAWLRRLDMNLRTPDALNIAIAQRTATTFATLDKAMAGCAGSLGMAVAGS